MNSTVNKRKSKQSRRARVLLTLTDSIISLSIITPLAIGLWRGIFQLMDLCLFSSNDLKSALTSFAFGLFVCLLICLSQDKMISIFQPDKGRVLYLLASRISSLIFIIANVNFWRGIWHLLDIYTGTSWNSGLTTTLLGIFILVIVKGLNNIVAPPFQLFLDTPSNFFKVPTMYNTFLQVAEVTDVCQCLCCKIIDACYSLAMITSLVVWVWRGSWLLLNQSLYPESQVLSALGSLIIGYALAVCLFLTQPIVLPFYRYKLRKSWHKLIFQDLYSLLSFASTINIWRGTWNLINLFVLEQSPLLSNTSTFGACGVVLILLQTLNTAREGGVTMDGRGPDDVAFRVSYLSHLYEKRTQLETMNDDLQDTNDREMRRGQRMEGCETCEDKTESTPSKRTEPEPTLSKGRNNGIQSLKGTQNGIYSLSMKQNRIYSSK